MLPLLLEAVGLKKHFPVTEGLVYQRVVGWIKAVDGIDFTVKHGETFGLVGESGCGKTTTSKLILLLETKTAGTLRFDGADIHGFNSTALKRYRASVQAVFQDPYSSLNPRMRVGDIVGEPLRINNVLSASALKERVEEVLTQVGLLPEAIARYPHEFSGGQRQRIAIARSLAPYSRLIVLDEPVSALDVSIRAQIMNLLQDLQQKLGLTFLLIAHNLATVRYMSKQVAIMYTGKIVEMGESDEIFTHPLHPYTQALFYAALPSHPRHRREESPLIGEVPNPLNPPPGCLFHPRCVYAKPVCRAEEPLLREEAPGHTVACHLY
ncbi:MAG: ATP-binding cassette domain-containing protein [Deltaproteobacteria bacterium]|nr:ATP-binding cassette domain-containing protein [Deltaproteobacteria bacterium]